MENNRYKDILEQIQADLAHTDKLENIEKETLLKLAAEINIKLDDAHIDMVDHPDLFINNLQKTYEKVQEEHPILAGLIKQLIDTLNNIGI
ncbi:MAG: DUF4404 family protein [Bacteriovoracaceae bacterium]|nr:DUF4404 family protein [Bacteriovoracaceae bacterium]